MNAPDPYVVRVFRRGGVDFKLLSDAIVHDRRCIEQGKFDDIPGLASAHEFLDDAQRAMPSARKLLPWKRDGSQATDCSASDGIWWCNSHKRQTTHTNTHGKRCCDPALGGILLPCHAVFIPTVDLCDKCKQPVTKVQGCKFCFTQDCSDSVAVPENEMDGGGT